MMASDVIPSCPPLFHTHPSIIGVIPTLPRVPLYPCTLTWSPVAFALLEADVSELHDESLEEVATILEMVMGRIADVRRQRAAARGSATRGE